MRRRFSRARWRSWLDDHSASCLSVSAFCQEHDIPENSFYYWRKKFAGEQCQEAEGEPLFVPVSVDSSSDFEVRFRDGVLMKVPRDAEAVRWVVDALRQGDGQGVDECSG